MSEVLLWGGSILLGLFVLLIVAAAINMHFDSKKKMRSYTLGLGQPERLSFDVKGISASGMKVSLDYACSEKNKPALLAHLENRWGFSFANSYEGRERILFCLKKLWNEGSVSLLLNSPQDAGKVNIDAMLAVDIASFVELVRHAVQLDLLDHEEAWGILFLNAQRAQSSFESWQEYVSAYIKGREYIFELSKQPETEAFVKFRNDINEYGVKEHNGLPTDVDWRAQPVFSGFEVVESATK